MHTSAFELIAQAGIVVKLILALLAGFSIISWGVILAKFYHLRAAARESAVLLAACQSAPDLKHLLKTAQGLRASPLAPLVHAVVDAGGLKKREDLAALLRRREAQEVERLQSHLTFLATTGSTAPFIGLLGTVWGIMDAFQGIGASGSASLAVVAPAIAEALIATAAGLAAAIPAVMAYNAFVSWIRRRTVDLESFSETLQHMVGA